MAEIKNNFIKSKMNKDLDDRLVPTGEYRNAQNVSISRSEGSDVGALENILGNSIIQSTVLNIPNIDVIGFLADNATNSIYLFLTDYTDASVDRTFAPANTNCIISRYNTITKDYNKLVEGRFLNFSKTNIITGVNLLESLLFWTDNRNQPRKINVDLANPGSATNPTYYISEDTISVAKPAPLESIKLVNIAQGLPLVSTMTNPSEEFLPNDAPKVICGAGVTGDCYNENWAGDPNYLQDKFIRFSYRYKFDDGEYSLIAPFTQICFIPKQQGYFLEGDSEAAYRSTVVQFVENNVTQIVLNILFETENPGTDLHITDLDILYKESDGLAIKVVESIPIKNVFSRMKSNVNKMVYDFTYISTKPYKTLPSDQTTRVYDKVPTRALAQEVSGNRVIYGNFFDKMSPPLSIDYGVGYSAKAYNSSAVTPQSQTEYPNHTVKQNRNYQVGVVLSDKFGRQSSVILSSRDTADNEEGIQYGGSTIYLPYYGGPITDILYWPGYALRILFNKAIPSKTQTDIPGYPGLYSLTNPLGWYSYKIVVRQQEQDYYNVYLPGILDGYPASFTGSASLEIGKTANIVLINDNINKVPRDLSEVGPDQRQFRSSVQLFGRVAPTSNSNEQYFPGTLSDTVVSISTVSDTNYNGTQGSSLTYPEFYQSETNPLIGRVSTEAAIGTIATAFYETLGVFETSPVVSLLDIYWETSSTGLISVLNTAIDEGFSGPATINLNGGYSQNEGMAFGTKIVNKAFIENNGGVPITTLVNFAFSSVIDGNGVNRTNEFVILPSSNSIYQFDIFTNALFYYGSNSVFDVANRSFTFAIDCEDTVGLTTEQLQFTGSVENVAPEITNTPNPTVKTFFDMPLGFPIMQMTGINGSNINGNQTQLGLTWSIIWIAYNGSIAVPENEFVIDPTSGIITNPNNTAKKTGNYAIDVILKDASGAQSQVFQVLASFGITEGINQQATVISPYAGGTEFNIEWITTTVSPIDTNMVVNLGYTYLCVNGCVETAEAIPLPADNKMTCKITRNSNWPNPLTSIGFRRAEIGTNPGVPENIQFPSGGSADVMQYEFTNMEPNFTYYVTVLERQ